MSAEGQRVLLARAIRMLDEVSERAWERYDAEGSPESRLQALDLVRRTTRDWVRALLDVGLIQPGDTSPRLSSPSMDLTPEQRERLHRALIECTLSPQLEPVPDGDGDGDQG